MSDFNYRLDEDRHYGLFSDRLSFEEREVILIVGKPQLRESIFDGLVGYDTEVLGENE
ncbi:hypothetical protein J4423_05585 [Candidatus Pacearchaeota archaeon]|nr:hypothetical protein [Candidatus Pacearchaeota archaeon]